MVLNSDCAGGGAVQQDKDDAREAYEMRLEKRVDAFEHKLITYAAPTLAGLKPANMFSCPLVEFAGYDAYGSAQYARVPRDELISAITRTAAKLAPFGVRVMVLANREASLLIFACRPNLLHAVLNREPVATLLEVEGYDVRNIDGCLTRLRARIASFDACPRCKATGTDRFPHEIGFFLGYPLEDVLGFVRYRGRGIKLAGCWNVYSDPERGKRLFDLYDQCTCQCLSRYGEGEPIEAVTCGDVSEVADCVKTAFGLQ